MRDADLRKLRCFVTVAEERSVTHAAERLHLAQPPLSRLIKQFEAELGVELFVRVPHGLVLTPAGEALLDVARRTLAVWTSGLRDVKRVADEATHDLRVALPFQELVRHAALWTALTVYRARRPQTRLEFLTFGAAEQDAALLEHRADVSVTARPASFGPPPTTLDQLVLSSERFAVLLPQDDWRAAWSAVPVGTLQHDALLAPNPTLAPEAIEQTLADLRRLGVTAPPHRYANSLTEGLALLALGGHVTLLPTSLTTMLPSFPVTARPLAESLTDVHLVLRWRRATPAASVREFVAVVREQFAAKLLVT